MGNSALSAQGTKLSFQALGAGPFVLIPECRDIEGPEQMRNEIELTSHDDDEESFTMGIRRKGDLTVTIGWNMTLAAHKALRDAHKNRTRDIYKLESTDGAALIFSGWLKSMSPSHPVDDGYTKEVTIRPTNLVTYVDP